MVGSFASVEFLDLPSGLATVRAIQGRSQGGARGAIAPPFFRANATWEERFMAENKLSSLGSRQKHERRRTRSRGEQRNQASWAETAISAHAH